MSQTDYVQVRNLVYHLTCCLAWLYLKLKCLDLNPSSAPNSTLLLMGVIRGNRWWLKHLESCHLFGRCSFEFPALGLGHSCDLTQPQWVEAFELVSQFMECLSADFCALKLKKKKINISPLTSYFVTFYYYLYSGDYLTLFYLGRQFYIIVCSNCTSPPSSTLRDRLKLAMREIITPANSADPGFPLLLKCYLLAINQPYRLGWCVA